MGTAICFWLLLRRYGAPRRIKTSRRPQTIRINSGNCGGRYERQQFLLGSDVQKRALSPAERGHGHGRSCHRRRITGVTCAYCLAERGFRPLPHRGRELCGGHDRQHDGQTLQHGVIYCKIKEKYGLDAARDYAASQNRAMDFVAGTAGRESIDCALRENTAYIYGENEQERDLLQKEYDAARSIGINARMVEDAAFPSGNKGLLAFPGQYVFHPVRYVEGLAAAAARLGARICCDTKASGIDDAT